MCTRITILLRRGFTFYSFFIGFQLRSVDNLILAILAKNVYKYIECIKNANGNVIFTIFIVIETALLMLQVELLHVLSKFIDIIVRK